MSVYKGYVTVKEKVFSNPKYVPEIILKQTIDLFESNMPA